MDTDNGKQSLREKTGRAIRFVTRDIWLYDTQEQTMRRKGLEGFIKWAYLVWHGFVKDQCLLRASALTYTTVLSIVPFLAVAFSISKGMGLQNMEAIRTLLEQGTAGNSKAVDHILTYVDRTNVGTLGAVGMATLLLTVGSLMGTIEKAFNSVWGIEQGRTLWRKFTDFFSVVLICPLIIGVAVSLSVTMSHEAVVQKILSISAFSYIYITLLKLLPVAIIALTLLFLYSFIPNTKVRIPSALVGAIIAATLWKIVENLYVTYQVGSAKYNAIYGGFAQVPLFLIWVYISWVIVLLGVEISFALQNIRTFENEIRSDTASREEQDKLAALAMLMLTRNFCNAEGAVSLTELSATLKAPVRLIQRTMNVMQLSRLVVQTCEDDPSYTLAAPPESIRFTDIILALASHRVTTGEIPMTETFTFINETFSALYADASRSDANLSLKEYVETVLPKDFGSQELT